MISDKQYREAKQLMKTYERQISLAAIQNLRCIGCNKAVEPVEGLLSSPLELDGGGWWDGTVARVAFGYGSRLHDGDSYYIALCDRCMHEAAEQGIAIHYQTLSQDLHNASVGDQE